MISKWIKGGASGVMLALAVVAVAGCGESTDVELVDVPQRPIPPGKTLEDMSKRERQRVGGSAFAKRDPSGMDREAQTP